MEQRGRTFYKIIHFSCKETLLIRMFLYWISICQNNIHHVVSVFSDAFLKEFLEIGLHSLQYCYVNLGDFHANSFLQIAPFTEYVGIHTSVSRGFSTRKRQAWTNQMAEWLQGISANMEMNRSTKRRRKKSTDILVEDKISSFC